MKVKYHSEYEKKRKQIEYQAIKEELEKLEKKLQNNEEVNWYKNISYHKKTQRMADSKGGFRVPVFQQNGIALLLDVILKQDIQHNEKEYYDKIFSKENIEKYKKEIDKIEENESVEEINLHKEIQGKIDFKYELSEYIYETQKVSQYFEEEKKERLLDIFNLIVAYETAKKAEGFKTLYKLNNEIYFKYFGEKVLFIYQDDNLKNIDQLDKLEDNTIVIKKAYPKEILYAQPDEWIKYVVQEKDGYIALSKEEVEILENTLKNKKFPLFINGRAGSGKSTIIQYIFAEYLAQFIEKNNEEPLQYIPLYLTYSEFLKTKAIEKVAIVIFTQQHLREKLQIESKKDIERKIKGYFKSFEEEFLKDLLEENTFENKTRIDFKLFQTDIFPEIIKKNKPKNSVENIWNIIRNNKESKVLKEKINKFKKYQHIIHSYEKICKKKNLYDDIDIIKAIFAENNKNLFSMVVCDEAQDFTSLEFELINKLSLRDAPKVFAGDPTQMITPTDFNFTELKTALYKNGSNVQDAYKELKFNYRSYKKITNFSNTIQILRAILFEKQRDRHQNKFSVQKSYTNKNGEVYFFDSSNEYVVNFLKEQSSAYDIIFPDDIQAQKFKEQEFEKESYIPLSSKGLEFDFVILYGFGEYYTQKFENDIKKLINLKNIENEYKYFFNNLYVAVTRAKNKLFIVDTQQGYNKFWSQLNTDSFFEKYKEKNKQLVYRDKASLLDIEKGEKEVLNDIDFTENKYSRLEDILLQRIFQEKNKTKELLNEVKQLIQEITPEQYYIELYQALYAESEEKYEESLEYFFKFLSGQKNELFQKKAFKILKGELLDKLPSLNINIENLELLEYYDNIEEIEILRYFCKKEYVKFIEFASNNNEYDELFQYIIENIQEVDVLEALYQYNKIGDETFIEYLDSKEISIADVLTLQESVGKKVFKHIIDIFFKNRIIEEFTIFNDEEHFEYFLQKLDKDTTPFYDKKLFQLMQKKLDISTKETMKLLSKVAPLEDVLSFYEKSANRINLLKYIQLNIDKKDIQKRYNIKDIQIISNFKDYKILKEKTIEELIFSLQTNNELTNENVVQKLQEIQSFINENYNEFSKENMQILFNTICGMKEELVTIKLSNNTPY